MPGCLCLPHGDLWGGGRSRGFPALGRRALVLGPSLLALTFPTQQLIIELVGLSYPVTCASSQTGPVAVAQVYREERNSP